MLESLVCGLPGTHSLPNFECFVGRQVRSAEYVEGVTEFDVIAAEYGWMIFGYMLATANPHIPVPLCEMPDHMLKRIVSRARILHFADAELIKKIG